jgi:hypothetical protein
MGASDWTFLNDILTSPQCDRGVTAGIARPNGGGDFCYGFNSLTLDTGAVGLFANQAGFAPMASGGSVRAAIQRGVSGGPQNFAPFLFLALQGQSVGDRAYMLGLGDDEPHHIVLKKGALSDGLGDFEPEPENNGILLRSTNAYTAPTWLHLRLDAIVQGSGDVLLQVYQSDLVAHSVTAPVWVPVPGMEGPFYPSFLGYVDDALGVNTGSQPLVGGRAGYGFYTADAARRGFFDQVQVGRQ